MYREGHVGAALIAYAPVGTVTLATGFEELAVFGALGAVGLAMTPDVDQRIPGIKHRGITHTVWFAAIIGATCGAAGALVGASDGILAGVGLTVWGFVVGTVVTASHVFADALTPAGVRPLAPYRDQEYSVAFARASNPIANYLLLAVGVGAVAAALWIGTTLGSL
jgi:inner membrane protein